LIIIPIIAALISLTILIQAGLGWVVLVIMGLFFSVIAVWFFIDNIKKRLWRKKRKTLLLYKNPVIVINSRKEKGE
jgi:hypothetical protein